MVITDTLLSEIAVQLKFRLTPVKSDAIRFISAFAARERCTDVRQLAYMLATAYHESRFEPICEIRAKPGTAVRKMQDRYWNTGYYGRGLCQLTWRRNYEKFGKLLNLPLIESPEMVLNLNVSAEILVVGMLRGLFSGKALPPYFPPEPTEPDWLHARRTVNGDFQADRVADAAKRIYRLLVSEAAKQPAV